MPLGGQRHKHEVLCGLFQIGRPDILVRTGRRHNHTTLMAKRDRLQAAVLTHHRIHHGLQSHGLIGLNQRRTGNRKRFHQLGAIAHDQSFLIRQQFTVVGGQQNPHHGANQAQCDSSCSSHFRHRMDFVR